MTRKRRCSFTTGTRVSGSGLGVLLRVGPAGSARACSSAPIETRSNAEKPAPSREARGGREITVSYHVFEPRADPGTKRESWISREEHASPLNRLIANDRRIGLAVLHGPTAGDRDRTRQIARNGRRAQLVGSREACSSLQTIARDNVAVERGSLHKKSLDGRPTAERQDAQVYQPLTMSTARWGRGVVPCCGTLLSFWGRLLLASCSLHRLWIRCTLARVPTRPCRPFWAGRSLSRLRGVRRERPNGSSPAFRPMSS